MSNPNYPIPLPTLVCMDVKGGVEISVSGKVVAMIDLKQPIAIALPEVVRAIQMELEEVAKKGLPKSPEVLSGTFKRNK